MQSDQLSACVLFADISGFTAMSEKLDPETATDIVNRWCEIMEAVVISRGGHVNKYLGDAILAVFGLDGAPDASRRGVQAALDLLAAMQRFNQEHPLPSPLDIHVGLDTGTVVTGDIGGEQRREFSVTGDTVNVAARLQSAAERGKVFVGPLARRETEADYAYSAVGSVPVGAGEAPVEAFELLGPRQRLRQVKRQSERRQATVIFADLKGLEALDAVTLTEKLNLCFARLERTVLAHGGVVDKYIGTCLMALFGVPVAIESAPQQAVNAAIDLRNDVERLASELGLELQVRIGINTGLVVAGETGGRIKRDFTVMGAAVNVASRLKDATRTGTILVGPNTYAPTRTAFDYEAVAPLRLKDVPQPVQAWEVKSVQARPHRLREQLHADLVGRDRELAAMHQKIGELIAGAGGAVSVVGEAGLGKSRLVSEVLGTVDAPQVRVLEGRSTSVGQNHSFQPFVDLLRQWALVSEESDERVARARVEAAVSALTPGRGDEIFPFIATLMGLKLEGDPAERLSAIEADALEKLIHKSMRELLVALSAERPLLLVFDDLHWADQSSIELLSAILRLADEARVLFVLVFRPGHEDTSERILAAVEREIAAEPVIIALDPLTAADSAQLVENLLRIEALPPAVRQLIVRKAEGNPFYIEEVVRSLIDLRAIERTATGYRVTERIESVEIPNTIQEVVLARLDRLEEGQRHILQLGAVIGRSFYYSLMTELLRREGTLDEELQAEMETLKQKQLLSERGTGWSVRLANGDIAEEVEYLFQHAVAQEAIYGSILQKTRREFHATVATTIEQVFTERLAEFYPMLAYHFSRAEDLEKAEHYLFQAGERAAKTAASKEALNFFQEAALLFVRMHGDGGDPRKRALLERNIGTALLTTGRLTECIDHFDRALELLGAPLAPPKPLRLATDIGAVLLDLYMHPEPTGRRPATETDVEIFDIVFRRFRALTTSDPKRLFADNMRITRRMSSLDPKTMGDAWQAYTLGSAAFSYSGTSFAISRRFLERAQRICPRKTIEDAIAIDFTRFTLNYLSGAWAEEPGIDDDAIEKALRHGVFWDVNSYLGLECDRKLRMGRFAEAEHCLERLSELGGSYGYEFAVANHDGTKPLLLLERRQIDEALALNDHYLEGRDEAALRIRHLSLRAKIQLLRGNRAAARADLDFVKGLLAKTDVVPPWHKSMYTVAVLRLLAHDLRDGVDHAQVRKRFKPAVREALKMSACVASVRAETYRLVAYLNWSLADQKAAHSWWDKAIAESRRLDAQPELARILLDRARCWAESPSSTLRDSSADQLRQCHEICQRLGMPDLTGIASSALA